METNKIKLLKESIKRYILKEIENISAASSAKNEDTFQKMDPLDDILSKYQTLGKVLTTLLTDHFKEYLNGIYIVAPKPTTFKVVLHNNQEFYLEYTGRTYEAKVLGRKYYLLNLGEEQQATKAIANLLKLGKPKENIPPGEEVENDASAPKAEPAKRGGRNSGGKNSGGKNSGGKSKDNPGEEMKPGQNQQSGSLPGKASIPGEQEKEKKQVK